MQWLQDADQNNVGYLSNVRRNTSRHLRNKKTEYLKVKSNKLETNRKKKNVRGRVTNLELI